MDTENSRKDVLPYLIMIMLFFLLILYLSYYYSISSGKQVDFMDTDNYMRLIRVEQLAETGDWYDSTIHRSNFPYGETLHWTRPLDILMLAGAYILTPFMGFEKGLTYWGIAISPFLGTLCLAALTWATKPFMDRKTQQLLWIIFIGQKILFQIFAFGRPDHHSLLALLFILLFGYLYRMSCSDSDRKYSLLGGLMAALSFWVSVESIFFIILVFLTMVTLWIMYGQSYARRLSVFSTALMLFSCIFLLVERPLNSIFMVEYDKLSIVHIFVFLIATIFACLLSLPKDRPINQKFAQLGAAAIPSVLILWAVFPDFFHGPMAGVNPEIVPIWLSRVSEVQPLLSSSIFFRVSVIGPLVLALIYLVHMFIKRKENQIGLLVLLISGAVLFIPLTLYQIRMAYHLMVLMVIVLTLFLSELVKKVSNIKNDRMKPFYRVTLILVFILAFPAAGLYTAVLADDGKPSSEYDLPALCEFLNTYQRSDPSAECILTYIDFGPEILYRTDFNVIATPYHRNDAGILYNHKVMAAESDMKAQNMLAERSVDLLILCPDSQEKKSYQKTSSKNTFYEHLIADKTPKFLNKIDLPKSLAESFIVYRVVHN